MSWKNRYSQSRYSSFAPYVPVAERQRQARAAAAKATKQGCPLSPVTIEGRSIATTFWGKSWCDNLESYSDYANRLPRGRTYVRNGSVIDLQLSSGAIAAQVSGSSLYRVNITISALDPKSWDGFKARCAGKISSLMDLLQGRLDKGVLAEITRQPGGLFPTPKEIKLSCSCPDGARLCKHVAAVLYGVGARLDTQPDLFFTLRHADMQELITAATAGVSAAADPNTTDDTLDADDLSALFGVDIDVAPPTPTPASTTRIRQTVKRTRQPAHRPSPAKTKESPIAHTPSKPQPAQRRSIAKKSPAKKSPAKKTTPRAEPKTALPAKKAARTHPGTATASRKKKVE